MQMRRIVAVLGTAALSACLASSASGSVRLPAPGTAKEVSLLVAASASVSRLPSRLVPSLGDVPNDNASTYFGVAGRLCAGVTKCVFGDTKSSTTIVLYGDSHAQMWLPALSSVAQRAGARLVLVWRPGCPDATVTVWDPETRAPDWACDHFRAWSIAVIRDLAPALVLLADRTSNVPGKYNVLTSDAAWEAGLRETIAALKSPRTKVAVIGDISALTKEPGQCLAAFPSSILACSVPNPNPQTHQHFAAEAVAAASEGVPYLNPQPWLCTRTCSPVIGPFAAYYDRYHVTATYAAFLAGVFGAALRSHVGI